MRGRYGMQCERNYCPEEGTHLVTHDRYRIDPVSNETVACRPHAKWWIGGAWGVRLGVIRAI